MVSKSVEIKVTLLLQLSLQKESQAREKAAVRGLPSGVYDALCDVYVSQHHMKPESEEVAGNLLRQLLADGEATGDIANAKFPPPIYNALLSEYTVRFGAEPATGEELPTFAKQLLAEQSSAISSASKSSVLGKFSTKEEATAQLTNRSMRKAHGGSPFAFPEI